MFALFLSRLLPLAAFAFFAEGSAPAPLPFDPPPAVSVVDYMKSIGKLGGQNKVPHLSNDRGVADALQAYKL